MTSAQVIHDRTTPMKVFLADASPIQTCWTLFAAVSAAFITLVGVLTSLIVTERRTRRESRVDREDQYRAAARATVAELLVAAHTYRRHGGAACDTARWHSMGEDRAKEFGEHAEAALLELERTLALSRLLVDVPLEQTLDRLAEATDAIAEVIKETGASFWEQRAPAALVHEAKERWHRYDGAREELRPTALRVLRPTVRDAVRAENPTSAS